MHWDGVSWGVIGGSGDPGYWAVAVGGGEVLGLAAQGTVVRWKRNAWTYDVRPDRLARATLTNLWASSENDVWVTGFMDASNPWTGVSFHWNGKQWKEFPLPQGMGPRELWGTGPQNVWMVGYSGRIAHWDGTSWTSFVSRTTRHLAAVHGSGPNDVWAVGEGGTARHWDGIDWLEMNPSTTADLKDVWVAGPSEIWVTTGNSNVLRFDGKTWGGCSIPGATPVTFLWGNGGSVIWMAGPYGTLAHGLTQTGKCVLNSSSEFPYWYQTAARSGFFLTGVTGGAPYAGGAGGLLLRWSPGWLQSPPNAPWTLSDAFGLGPDVLLAIGESHKVMQRSLP